MMVCVFFFVLGKVLIIGGGIANFTNVATTFKVTIINLTVC